MHIFPAANYDKILSAEASTATKRVYLSAMIIMAGPRTDPLFTALRQALRRGVEVMIVYDAYGLHPASRTSQTRQAFMQAVARSKATFEELRQLGATIVQTASASKNPFKGVNHIKLMVIDDTVHSFGGINLVDIAFSLTDYMLVVEDPGLAKHCVALIQKVATQRSFANEQWSTARQTVLIDGGEPGVSIIYNRACELSAQAISIYYVSATQPTGKLSALLDNARTTCYFNRPNQLPMANKIAYFLDRVRGQSKATNAYRRDNYIHAKFMLFEMSNGQHVALSGSHNFDWRGVTYGTKEIALESIDESLWKSLYDFMQHEIA